MKKVAPGPVLSSMVLGLAVVLAACAPVGVIPAYLTAGDGAKACAAFSLQLQVTSSHWATAGWVAGIVAGLLSALGGILGTGDQGARWYRKLLGVLFATLGGSLAATSAYSVSRSNAASSAAASAAAAMVLPAEPADGADRCDLGDRETYNRCAQARANWLDSRVESLDQAAPPQSRKSAPPVASPTGTGTGTGGKGGTRAATGAGR